MGKPTVQYCNEKLEKEMLVNTKEKRHCNTNLIYQEQNAIGEQAGIILLPRKKMKNQPAV